MDFILDKFPSDDIIKPKNPKLEKRLRECKAYNLHTNFHEVERKETTNEHLQEGK